LKKARSRSRRARSANWQRTPRGLRGAAQCLQRAAWVTAPLARRELACMAAVISGAELEAKLAAAPSDAAQSLPGLLTSAGGLQGVASPPAP
jgi:hypothetical protein